MTPREFLDEVVRPNAEEFEADFGSIRRAHNAVASVDALAARIFCAARALMTASSEGSYREQLAVAHPDFRVLRDLANALKHYELTRQKPTLTGAAQVSVQSPSWDEARWDEARWGSPPQVHVRLDNGDLRAVDYLVRNGIAVLESEMTRCGL